MREYRNQNGNSGITAYDIGDDYIDVEFKNGGIYRYEEAAIGRLQFLNMQVLAIMGSGLNAFITMFVKGQAIRIRH